MKHVVAFAFASLFVVALFLCYVVVSSTIIGVGLAKAAASSGFWTIFIVVGIVAMLAAYTKMNARAPYQRS